MNSSEVLDTALRIYQRLGLTFLRLTAAPALLCLASIGFIQCFVLPELFLTNANASGGQMIEDVSGALATGIFVGGPLFLLGLAYSSTMVVSLVSDYMIGATPDPDAAASAARSMLPRLFLVNLKEFCLATSGIVVSACWMAFGGYLTSVTRQTDAVAGVVAGTGLIGLAGGGLLFLYVIARDALAAPVAVLEDAGPRIASKRSRELIRKQAYHPVGTGTIWSLYLLLAFIAAVLMSGTWLFAQILSLTDRLSALLSFLPAEQVFIRAFELIPTFLVIWTLTPVWATVITIVYYERKIRLEGFDIDLLASEITRSNRALGAER